LVGYFKSLCSFVIKFWAQILGEPCVFLGQMGGFMKRLGPKLDHLGGRDWKYSNKFPSKERHLKIPTKLPQG
jgi:hypothetical protein